MILEKIKMLLGIKDDSKDELIENLISLCAEPILNYINEEEIPLRLNSCLIEFVIVRYNKLNSEGYVSEGIDGASINYIDNYFETIKGQLDDYLIVKKQRNKKGIKFI